MHMHLLPSTGDLDDLCDRLARLAATHRSAPLVTVDYSGGSRQASDAQMMGGLHGQGDRTAGAQEGLVNDDRQAEGWELL